MKNYLTSLSFALLGAVSTTGMAQGTAPSTDRPKAIGVPQATADEAHRKAVQQGDVATVVRTGPSAKDKAKDATATVKDETAKAKRKVKTDGGTQAGTDTTKP